MNPPLFGREYRSPTVQRRRRLARSARSNVAVIYAIKLATSDDTMTEASPTTRLTRYAWLSIGTALSTVALKTIAWMLTSSVGLLSDALESVVNVGAAVMLMAMLRLAAMPEDDSHAYGRNKAEYFASGFEGMLVVIAAGTIAYSAGYRLVHPRLIDHAGIGLVLTSIASALNLFVSRLLMRAGRKHRSIALEADAQHLMTDVWTSAGVILGVALVALSDWLILDPLIALAVALNILVIGWRLLKDSIGGLMDAAWPIDERAALESVLDEFRSDGLRFHAVRTRRSGARRFASFHVLVPGGWTVQRGHDVLEEIERRIARRVPAATVDTHLEPIEDPSSYQDQRLDRDYS
jgi:cation diffusion facilitator family transporter